MILKYPKFKLNLIQLTVLLLTIILTSCKNNLTPSPVLQSTQVEYVYSSGTQGTYQVEYTGVDGKPVDTTYTGTSFVKTITVYRSSGFKIAKFTVTLVVNGPYATGDGELSIYADNEPGPAVIADINYPNTYSANPYTQSCSVSVFG